jgi:hypothetical protein
MVASPRRVRQALSQVVVVVAQPRDVLPFGRLWYGEPNAISYAKFFSCSHDALIRV